MVCGSTGEAAALSKEEQLAVLDAVLEVAPDHQVVMGLSGNNMVATLQMQQAIQLRDIAGVLIPAPYYIRPSQCGLIDYFTQLADASTVPVILQHSAAHRHRHGAGHAAPARTPPAHRRHQDCGGSPDATMALIADGEIDVMTGEDNLILTTLCLGGTGAISAAAHVHPERFVQLTQQVAAGDLRGAQQLHELLPMIHQMFSFPNPAPVKTVLPSRADRQRAALADAGGPQALQQQIAATLAQLQPAEAIIG